MELVQQCCYRALLATLSLLFYVTICVPRNGHGGRCCANAKRSLFRRKLTNKTRNIASKWSPKWVFRRGDNFRLRRERGEVMQLNFVVEDHGQDTLFESFTKSRELDVNIANLTLFKDARQERSPETGINGEDINAKLDCYRTLSEAYDSMRSMAEEYPGFVSIRTIGKSYMKIKSGDGAGNDIKVLVLSAPSSTENKADMLIVGGQHSREFPPPEALLRWAKHLLDSYGTSADIHWILDQTNIHIVPFVNPDGREIVQDHLSWNYRKNAHRYGCKNGVRMDLDGVDLNRNYPVFWGLETGSSGNACDEDYRGPAPLSEPESSSVFRYFQEVFSLSSLDRGQDKPTQPCPSDTRGIFMDIHSSPDGEFVYLPWAVANTPSPNHHSLLTLSSKLAHFGNYSIWGPHQDGLLYFVSGDITDATYGLGCIPSVGLEIGPGGFYADCDALTSGILPVAYDSLLYAAKVASAPYTISLGPDVLSISQTSLDSSNKLKWVVQVSDEELIVPHAHFEFDKSQHVAGVRLFVDEHPDDETATGTAMDPDDGQYGSVTETAVGIVDITNWDSGQHIVYFQATDSLGNRGPVSAAFFDAPADSEHVPDLGSRSPSHQGYTSLGWLVLLRWATAFLLATS